MNEKLFFITALDEKNNYKYIYVIAYDRNDAKAKFLNYQPHLIIKAIKSLHPSKRNQSKINEIMMKKYN